MANMSKIRDMKYGTIVENPEGYDKVVTEYKSLEDVKGIAYKDEYQARIVESVYNIIEKSPNLIYALEGVAAAYCCPSTFLRNDDINTIKVVGDSVIAPGVTNTLGNKEAVVKTIAALLDKKSEDIDHAIDHHHHHHCRKLFKERPQFNPDPSKGNVVGRYFDDEDNEILVYNTGIIDHKHCPATDRKLAELQSQGLLPDYNIDVLQAGCNCDDGTKAYFADMDDITQGIDMSGDVSTASPVTEPTTGDTEPTVNDFGSTDISTDIGESDEIVEACTIFEHTHQLGYELMKLQGFDYVKPTTQIIKEANEEVIAGGSVPVDQLEFMRFDNKHIINAVKYINGWVEKTGVDKIGDVPFDDLYKSDDFSFAIDELCEQFDAKIRVHYRPSASEINVYTTCDEMKASKLRKVKISKTKGFQFSGNPIDIYIIGKNSIRDFSIGKVEFIGQTIISILLHEIFHNAMWVWKINDTEFSASFAITLQLASQTPSARKRRKIISNYVNMIDKYYGCDLNRITRKILVKRLTTLTAIGDNPSKVKKLKERFKKTLGENKKKKKETNPDNDVLETINMYEKYMTRYEKHLKKKTCLLNIILGTAGVVGSAFLFKKASDEKGHGSAVGFEIAGTLTGITGTTMILMGISATIERALMKEAKRNYENSKDLEEQWCDMFAAMYKLPVTFKIMTANRKTYTDDKISKDIIERFNRIDIDIHKMILDCHPSGAERNYQAVKISRALLEEADLLDPEIKKYLEWITEAYKQTGDQDEIEDIYNKSVFDPKEAENLDAHLAHLIDISDAPVVEYTEYDVLDWGIVME